MADFKNRLRELRKEKGLSKWDVANSIENASPHTIRKYETEGISSKIKNIIKIARFFNVSTDYILGVTDTKTINLKNVSSDELLRELKSRLK